MEDRVFVEAFVDVSKKVFDCFWGFISKEYNGDVTLTGFKLNDRVLRERRRAQNNEGQAQKVLYERIESGHVGIL